MKNTSASAIIAAPYAEALMSVAQANNLIEQIGEDARSITSVLANSPELRDFLGSPVIDAAKKKAVLGQVFGDSLQPYTANILRLLVDRRRILFLEEICQQYQALLRQLKQTVLAEVISAVELSEAQRQAVTDKVKALTGAQQVELETKIDREIIGGVIIKVGSQIIDASLRGQLRRIGLRLSA